MKEVQHKLSVLGFDLDLGKVESKTFEVKKKNAVPSPLDESFDRAISQYEKTE